MRYLISLLLFFVCAVNCVSAQSIRMLPFANAQVSVIKSGGQFTHLSNPSFMLIAKDNYTRNFGFFCRQELKLEHIGLPLKFRLGSMENCNYLEGKNKTLPNSY